MEKYQCQDFEFHQRRETRKKCIVQLLSKSYRTLRVHDSSQQAQMFPGGPSGQWPCVVPRYRSRKKGVSGDLGFGISGAGSAKNHNISNIQILSFLLAFELTLPWIQNMPPPISTWPAAFGHSPLMSFFQPHVILHHLTRLSCLHSSYHHLNSSYLSIC